MACSMAQPVCRPKFQGTSDFLISDLSFALLSQVVRKVQVWPVGSTLDESFRVFVDSRDSGPLILTHLYLLAGFSIPLWLGVPRTNMESEDLQSHFRQCDSTVFKRVVARRAVYHTLKNGGITLTEM